MKKILTGCFLFTFSLLAATAQQTSAHTNSEKLFYEGKDLYAQKKFAASTISFENYLKTADQKQSETVQESNYYLAANAYELRKDNALYKLKKYLTDYPYTTFSDHAYFMIGTLEYEQRNFKDASLWYGRININALNGDDYNDYLFRYGYTQLQQKRYRESKYLFGQLIGKGTRYENSANYYYAYNEYTLKNYETALESFKKVQDNQEYSGFVPYYMVQIYYFQKRYDELIPLAEDVISKNPRNENNAELYRILGDCYYQQKNFEKTAYYLSEYKKVAPKLVRNDLYMLGIAYYNLQKYLDAIDCLTNVTSEKDAITQNAYLHLGISYLKTNQKSNARMAFLQASKMDFDKEIKEEAAYNYALATYELSFSPFNESVVAFEAFLNEYPDSKYNDQVYDYLINVYLTTNNYQAAYESMQKIKKPGARIQEAKQRVLFNMGVDAFIDSKFDKAIVLFTNSLNFSSYNSEIAAQTRYWRGDSYYRLGKYALARKDFNDFLLSAGARLTKEFNLASYNIGYSYFNEKNYTNALSSFRKYIVSESNKQLDTYADALNRIGDCYFIDKSLDDAYRFYTDAAALKSAGADYATFQKGFVQGLQKDYRGKISTLQGLIKDFPNTEFKNSALYEIGHSYVMLNEYEEAIETFDKLYAEFPFSNVARKGLLQKGMLYYNVNQYDNSIFAYKQLITAYPKSEEAKTALDELEKIYVQTNRVNEYTAYVKTLGSGLSVSMAQEDSLTFIAAERQYLMNNYNDAARYLSNYLKSFAQGKYATKARYYLADSYYVTDNKKLALQEYKTLSLQDGNPYMETSLARAAEISYDEKNFAEAVEYFKRLKDIAENKDNVNAARVGILRCNVFLNNPQGTIEAATEILADPRVDIELAREARYYRAKANLQMLDDKDALPDLTELALEPRHIYGSEANYLLANYYYQANQDEEAEKIIFDFISKNTPHQYWLARSFVLLADIYIRKGDDFQAKQYLLSLQENYTKTDSIQEMIVQRLARIEDRERDKVIIDVE